MKYKRDMHMKFEVILSLVSEIMVHFFTPPLQVFYEVHNKFFTKIIFFPQTKFEQLFKGSFEEIYSQRITTPPHIRNW